MAFVLLVAEFDRPSGFVMKCHERVDRSTHTIALGDVDDGAFGSSIRDDQFRRGTEFDHAESGGSRQTIARLQRTDDATSDRS